MTIIELIEIAENRIKHYSSIIEHYTAIGDVEQVSAYQTKKEETELTLQKLKSIENLWTKT